MGPPDISEFDFGLIEKAVISGIESASHIVGGSSVYKISIVSIEWQEWFREFGESDSVIAILVVSFEVEF